MPSDPNKNCFEKACTDGISCDWEPQAGKRKKGTGLSNLGTCAGAEGCETFNDEDTCDAGFFIELVCNAADSSYTYRNIDTFTIDECFEGLNCYWGEFCDCEGTDIKDANDCCLADFSDPDSDCEEDFEEYSTEEEEEILKKPRVVYLIGGPGSGKET